MRAAAALLVALAAACSSVPCEDVPLPVPMSLGRAAELAPDITRGVALSTSLRATACPTTGPDGGPLTEVACGPRGCGVERRALEVLVLPLGQSVPRHAEGCVRRASELAPLASARATASSAGELVLALPAGPAALYVVDPAEDCAACGRRELGEACEVTIPPQGLVVRDVVLDRL